ncbi:MAG: Gfo/Idh/MocA family oxidoreductase [Pirellulales bacterium]|nr:Gfo/Idh/MocA family oxidoreductase [Pirellulales bacterium]
MITNSVDRRDFMTAASKATLSAAGAAMLAQTALAQTPPAAAASERVRLAVVGLHGRGGYLARKFAARADCEIAYLCDVDESLLPACTSDVEQLQGRRPEAVGDFRRALDDANVDALVVATPDHWHALATVWGCQANKDVYVEKPVSHSPWEGRRMVEAARRYERIVQVGTQNRSAPYNIAAKAYIDSGKLGGIHLVRVFNQKSWPNFPAAPERPTPTGLDWDMWTGPAPESRYNENYHRRWNHFWRFSGGDIINDGVHQIDLARWLVGKTYPNSVYSTGGRFAEPGVCESPDTQVAVFQFDDLVMLFELTLYTPYMLKSDQALRDSDRFPYWPQNAERIEIYGSEALMVVGRHGCGWQVFDRPKDRQPVIAAEGNGPFPDDVHFDNFLACVRSRQRPSADVEEGHRSTLLCQLANISYRLGGRKLLVDSQSETLAGDDEANGMLRREYRAPWVVPEKV